MFLVSSYGRRIRWFFSLVLFGNIEEEGVLYELRVEFLVSGVMLEVWISIRYMLFVFYNDNSFCN